MQRRPRTVIQSLALSLACSSAVAWPAFAQPTTAPSGGGINGEQVQQPAAQDDQSSQPDRPMRRFGRDFRGDDRFGGPGSPDGGGGPGGPGVMPEPPQEDRRVPGPFEAGNEEWDRAMAFMKEHSPKRTALLGELQEDWQQRVREQMFMRYRMLERFRNADKEMYDIALRRVGLEDELWTIRMEVRMRGKSLTPEEVSKVRERVTALVDLNLEERELRVQRLRDILRREEDMLAREKGQRDPSVAENIQLIESGQRGGVLGGGGGSAAPRARARRPRVHRHHRSRSRGREEARNPKHEARDKTPNPNEEGTITGGVPFGAFCFSCFEFVSCFRAYDFVLANVRCRASFYTRAAPIEVSVS